jgi:hypothetical protein
MVKCSTSKFKNLKRVQKWQVQSSINFNFSYEECAEDTCDKKNEECAEDTCDKKNAERAETVGYLGDTQARGLVLGAKRKRSPLAVARLRVGRGIRLPLPTTDVLLGNRVRISGVPAGLDYGSTRPSRFLFVIGRKLHVCCVEGCPSCFVG